MSSTAWWLLALHVPLAYLLVADRFRTVNRWADRFEDTCLPPWFRWSTQGDKVSWVQHGLIALLASQYGGLLSLLAPESWAFGCALVGWCAFAGYVVRETRGAPWGKPNAWTHPAPNRVGWAVDGLMDVVGPLAVAVAWTLAP